MNCSIIREPQSQTSPPAYEVYECSSAIFWLRYLFHLTKADKVGDMNETEIDGLFTNYLSLPYLDMNI